MDYYGLCNVFDGDQYPNAQIDFCNKSKSTSKTANEINIIITGMLIRAYWQQLQQQ